MIYTETNEAVLMPQDILIGRRHEAHINRVLELSGHMQTGKTQKEFEEELINKSPRRVAKLRKRLEKDLRQRAASQ